MRFNTHTQFRTRAAGALGAVALSAATVAMLGGGAALASPAPAASGTEHLQLMSTSATSNKASIVVTGVFTAGGVDVQGNKSDTVKFGNGSFKIAHSNGTGTQKFNPTTCLMTIRLHGTYKISDGTGKYKGISGHGTYRLSILGVGARVHGKCSQKAPPTVFQQLINASGPVHL
jgi:hypothetical protein